MIPGLESLVQHELANKLPSGSYQVFGYPREGRVSIRYEGDVTSILALRSVIAIHRVEQFDVTRPRALLGHQNMTRILASLRSVVNIHPRKRFNTFRISAAGEESTVYKRLRCEIAASLDLDYSPDVAHLLICVRKSPTDRNRWQVLVRLTPMPLSARSWRACNRPDALNATIAYAMVSLANPENRECFLNLGCGSGSLLIERLLLGPASTVVGVDISEDALDCTRKNLSVAGLSGLPVLMRCDMQRLPLSDASFDTIVTDLPFGMIRGTRVDLNTVYSGALSEAARLVRPEGIFVAITARRRLFKSTFERFSNRWEGTVEVPLRVSFNRGYINPSVYVMRRGTD